jgi:hypothetical protein
MNEFLPLRPPPDDVGDAFAVLVRSQQWVPLDLEVAHFSAGASNVGRFFCRFSWRGRGLGVGGWGGELLY